MGFAGYNCEYPVLGSKQPMVKNCMVRRKVVCLVVFALPSTTPTRLAVSVSTRLLILPPLAS
jgi:hypothetical protein